MHKIIALSTILFLLSACANNNHYTNTPKDSIEKPGATNAPLGATNGIIEEDNENLAPQVNFIVGNTNFRSAISEDSCIIEKQLGNGWAQVVAFERKSVSYPLIDVNNDGFIDIVNKEKWYSEIYLFNSETKTYDSSKPLTLENERILIDSVNNIFCSHSYTRYSEYGSFLYTFNKTERNVLYSVEFDTKEDQRGRNLDITAYSLYQGNYEEKEKRKLLKRVELADDDSDFNYGKFWKENYKQLLQLK